MKKNVKGFKYMDTVVMYITENAISGHIEKTPRKTKKRGHVLSESLSSFADQCDIYYLEIPAGEIVVEYIRLNKSLFFEERKGRYTSLEKESPGFLLNQENFKFILLSDIEKRRCLAMLGQAKQEQKIVALVQGYLCCLNSEEFYRCDAPKMYPVPAEII